MMKSTAEGEDLDGIWVSDAFDGLGRRFEGIDRVSSAVDLGAFVAFSLFFNFAFCRADHDFAKRRVETTQHRFLAHCSVASGEF